MDQAIPDDIVAFLRDVVTSLEQLAVLVALRGDPARWYGAPEIVDRVGVPVEEIEEALAELHAHHLLETRGAGETQRWRYSPRSPELAGLVDRLVELYESRQIEILRVLSSHAMARIRSSVARAFADAFVIGRRKDG